MIKRVSTFPYPLCPLEQMLREVSTELSESPSEDIPTGPGWLSDLSSSSLQN